MGQRAYWAQLEERLVDWVDKALRRKPTGEERVSASLRVAAAYSPKLRRALANAADVLIDRSAFDRPLYGAAVRALADVEDSRLSSLLCAALANDRAGGLATLAAAARCGSPSIDEPLARSASSRHPEVAFAAALVRRLRNDAKGSGHLLSAAARLKESARIEVCTELLAPLTLRANGDMALPKNAAPALRALRDSERHLGRWLVFARAGLACGDRTPLEEASQRARVGSQSAKASWALLMWALDPGSSVPGVRPTTEIVARLSDRPTADRDMSFLFRLASARAAAARSLLEQLSRPPLKAATAVRAASALACDYALPDALGAVRSLADGERRDLRGIAVAALWDGGDHVEARQRAPQLAAARNLSTSVWGGLVMGSGDARTPVISEASFRHLEQGWVQ